MKVFNFYIKIKIKHIENMEIKLNKNGKNSCDQSPPYS